MDSNVLDRVRDSLQEFLTSKGLRRTVQREAIIDAAFGTNEHFTAEELLVMARRIEKSVSRATVYRTLPLLVQSCLLHELDLGSDTKIYDPNFVERPTHNHLICVDCDKIFEFEDTNMELLENCITRRLGFSPASKAVTIEGHCDELKLKGTCRNQRRPKS
jgi:Fur family transcriptional regulator, ferric uptake regulator